MWRKGTQRCWYEGLFSGLLNLGASSLDLVCMHHKLLYVGRHHHHFCSIAVTKDHPGIKCSFFSAALKQSGVKWVNYQLSSSTLAWPPSFVGWLVWLVWRNEMGEKWQTKKPPKRTICTPTAHIIIFKVQEMLNISCTCSKSLFFRIAINIALWTCYRAIFVPWNF